jgi:hypothetical protein
MPQILGHGADGFTSLPKEVMEYGVLSPLNIHHRFSRV